MILRINPDLKLKAEIRWLFRQKAKLKRTNDEHILLEIGSYQVETLYKKDRQQYEPRLLFGKLYAKNGQLIEIGKLLMVGLGTRAITRQIGCCNKTVGRIRKVLNEYIAA